jgi:hypothetical protein
VALVLAAVLVVGIGVHDAAARRKKGSVIATIDGKRRKWNAKKLTVDVSGNQVTFVATIKRPRLNQLIPGLSMSCQLDLGGIFPVTPQFPQPCVLGYSEFRASRNPVYKRWGGSNFENRVEVTFDSLNGDILTGRFRGTLTSQNTPPNPDVTVENGTFSINVGG